MTDLDKTDEAEFKSLLPVDPVIGIVARPHQNLDGFYFFGVARDGTAVLQMIHRPTEVWQVDAATLEQAKVDLLSGGFREIPPGFHDTGTTAGDMKIFINFDGIRHAVVVTIDADFEQFWALVKNIRSRLGIPAAVDRALQNEPDYSMIKRMPPPGYLPE